MDELLQRAAFLIQRRKYREAESILRGLLAQDPQNARTLFLYCEVKLQLKEIDAALQMINTAIGISPSDDRLFYRRARVYMQQEEIDSADKDFRTAISLNPQQSEYFAALAILYSLTKTTCEDLEETLRLAEQALQLNPVNIRAQNARSAALRKLGRKEESLASIRDAFSHSPDNAYTHANYGWTLLGQNDVQPAMEHFREALRIDPSSAYAQAGMREALKARYWLYRVIFRYNNYLLDPNTDHRSVGMLLLATLLVAGILFIISKRVVWLQPFVTPVSFFVIMLGLSNLYFMPIGNLFLRFSAYGRHLLHKNEMAASTLAGICLGFSLAGLAAYIFTGQPGPLAAYMVCFMLIPHLNIWALPLKKQAGITLLALVSVLLGVSVIVWSFVADEVWHPLSWAFFIWFFVFFGIGERISRPKS